MKLKLKLEMDEDEDERRRWAMKRDGERFRQTKEDTHGAKADIRGILANIIAFE